jgi:phosphoglucosamine mutase
MIAKSVFDALGAKTYTIGVTPDGLNINENIGSTHIENLASFVRENHLNIGFAFDGDADRCLAVDEMGNIITGDHILYLLAENMKKRGELYQDTVVTTIMSNLGLYQALDRLGLKYEQTAVGDRYVYENMRENGFTLGGEQSGHIILSKYATTGDGILTAIKVMEAVIASKLPLSKLVSAVTMLPQVMKNVRVESKAQAKENPKVKEAVTSVREKLSGIGRILVRESGTEPVIRVMVEAPTLEICEKSVQQVIDVMESEGLVKDV